MAAMGTTEATATRRLPTDTSQPMTRRVIPGVCRPTTMERPFTGRDPAWAMAVTAAIAAVTAAMPAIAVTAAMPAVTTGLRRAYAGHYYGRPYR